MIRGIIFDYDGTLSNRFESEYRMYRWMIEEISGMDPSSIEFEEIAQECLYWDQYGHAGKGYVFNRLKETHFKDLDVEKCSHIWAEQFHRFQMPMEGSYETLKKLKEKYRLGILSNGDSVFQRSKICELGYDAYVNELIVCGDYGIQKPDPKIFEIAAQRLGLTCEEIAFVGDTFYKDISGAIKAGMMPVWMCVERKEMTYYPGITVVHNYQEIENLFLGEVK